MLLTISFVDADWIESKPTGKSNLAVCDKWINKFAPTFITSGPTNGSKSAAAMLADRDNQVTGGQGPNTGSGQASPKFGGNQVSNGGSQPQDSAEAGAIKYESDK